MYTRSSAASQLSSYWAQGARHRFCPCCTCAIIVCPSLPDLAHFHVSSTCIIAIIVFKNHKD